MYNVRNIDFSRYYIFFGFWTRFYQMMICTPCNTWRDVTIACYLHTVKITLLGFSQCENNSLWKYPFDLMDKISWKYIKKRIFSCLTLNIEFIPRVRQDFFFIFSRVFLKSCLNSEINSILNVRNRDISGYYIFLGLLTYFWHCMQLIKWRDPVFYCWKCNKYVDTFKKNTFISIQNYMYRNNVN